jgi:predicted RNA-binding protein (virulence factor B family)
MSEKILLRKKSPTHKVEAKPAKARPVFDSESDLDSDLESDSETHAETGNSEPQTLSLGEIGEIALLEVVDKSSIGTFLDWGKPKDLFLPFAEQTRDLSIGDEILVHIYLDNTQRPAASMRLEKFLKKTPLGLEEFSKSQKEVDLLIYMKTDLGYKAVVNGCYQVMFLNLFIMVKKLRVIFTKSEQMVKLI